MNFIAVGNHGYYYFIGRCLILSFSFLTEPEGVRKELEKNSGTFSYSITFVFRVLLENN
jgi:hypothetical protein